MHRRSSTPSRIAALAFALAVTVPTLARAAGIHVELEPQAVTLPANTTFTVKLAIFQADAQFNAFDAYLRFDPTRLAYVSGTNAADSLVTTACSNRFQIFQVLNKQPADPDTLSLNLSLLCAGVSMTGPGALYKFQFRTLGVPGPTTISLVGGTAFYDAGRTVQPVETRDMVVTQTCPPITVSPASLPNGFEGAAYSATVSASGGTAPYSFTLAAGALPPGLALATSGALSGTPSTAGASTFDVLATDAVGCTATRTYSVTISCPAIGVTPASLPDATAGTPYTQSLSASGGRSPYTFAVTAGALPDGLALAGDGSITGTASTPGTASFTVTATDAGGCTGARAYALHVACAPVTLSPATLPPGTHGEPYSASLGAAGGAVPYTFDVVQGSLPPGLVLSSAGVISGTPTASGNAAFTVRATDANGCSGTRDYVLAIGCASIDVTPATLPDATVSAAYSASLGATGGDPPYTFAVIAGSLPDGLALSAGGELTGTPTQTGAATFTAQATDASGCTGAREYNLQIECPGIVPGPARLPDARVGAPYNATLATSGGVPPYQYETFDALPDGLTLAKDGSISGTPTTAGEFTFTIGVADANGCSASQVDTITVFDVTGVEAGPVTRFALGPVAPNPRIGGAPGVLTFALPRATTVSVELFDAAGRRVAEHPRESFAAGHHAISWRVPTLASGVYLVHIRTGDGDTAVARWVIMP